MKVGCDHIDQNAAEAHAWLAGYSLGLTGAEYEPHRFFTEEAVAAEHRKGYDKGRELYLSPVKR